MRLVAVCVVVVLGACGGGDWKHADPNRLSVEDVALWFAKASLAGDRATARTMMLEHHELARFTLDPPTPAAWNAELDGYLAGREREGEGVENPLLRAKVVETKQLRAGDESKLEENIRLAIVRLEVHHDGDWHAAPMPLVFVETPAGWKFTPKQ